jgi:uncharacterized tellurite resistance protein B-like protein
MIRYYPRNSPRAAARIVAMTMLADGHLSPKELDLLDHVAAGDQLGLTAAEMRSVVHAYCEDLLSSDSMCWAGTCRVEPETMADILNDVDDPCLRRLVASLCLAVVQADDHVADGESVVLHALIEQWGLAHDVLASRLVAANAVQRSEALAA